MIKQTKTDSGLLAEEPDITAALQRAGREAVLRHARLGNPVATWRDGKVVWLSPEEVLAQFEGTGDNGRLHEG